MKLPANKNTSSFEGGGILLIEKGYYPARFIGAKVRLDKDKNEYVGKFGKQMILSFEVFDHAKGVPTKPMVAEIPLDNGNTISKEGVILNSFQYHMFKKKDTGQFDSALTKNSGFTKTFTALGFDWEKDADSFDTDNYIGNWCEVNVNDLTTEKDGKKITRSSIVGIAPYKKGPHNIPQYVKKEEGNSPNSSSATQTLDKTLAQAAKQEDIVPSSAELQQQKKGKEVSYGAGVEIVDATGQPEEDPDADIPLGAKEKIKQLLELKNAGHMSEEAFKIAKADIIKKAQG